MKSPSSVADLPLFSSAPMTRRTDGETSRDAAARIAPKVNALHELVLDALFAAGARGLNDRELERLPQFSHYGPSTIRKRRSELYQLGLVTHQSTRDGLMVWVPVPGAPRP